MRSWRMILALGLVVLWANLLFAADLTFRGTGGCIEDASGTGLFWVASKGHPISVLFENDEVAGGGLARITVSTCTLDGVATSCELFLWDNGTGTYVSVLTGLAQARYFNDQVSAGYFLFNWTTGPGASDEPKLLVCAVKQN